MLLARLLICFVAATVCVDCGKDPGKKETKKEEKLRHQREDDEYARRRAAERTSANEQITSANERAAAFVDSQLSIRPQNTDTFLANLLPLAAIPVPALTLPVASPVVKSNLDKEFQYAKLGLQSSQGLGLVQTTSRDPEGALRTSTGLVVNEETAQSLRGTPWELFSSGSSVGSVAAQSADSLGQPGERRHWQQYPVAPESEFVLGDLVTPDPSERSFVDVATPDPSVVDLATPDVSVADDEVVDEEVENEEVMDEGVDTETDLRMVDTLERDIHFFDDICPVMPQQEVVVPGNVEITVDILEEIQSVVVSAAAVIVHMESNDHIPPSLAVVVCSVESSVTVPVVSSTSAPGVSNVSGSSAVVSLSSGVAVSASITSPIPTPAIGNIITIPK